MRFMMVVSAAAATGRARNGAPCLITYQSGPIRMEARLREIQRERKGEAEADAQQNCFTCAHTRALSMPIATRNTRFFPWGVRPRHRRGSEALKGREPCVKRTGAVSRLTSLEADGCKPHARAVVRASDRHVARTGAGQICTGSPSTDVRQIQFKGCGCRT